MNINAELDTTKIQKELEGLSQELQDKAVKAGIATVAIEGVKLMRQYAPVDTGRLRKSIRRKKLPASARAKLNVSPNLAAVIVGPNYKGMGRIANVLEGGAKHHLIKPREESNVQKFLRAQGLRGKKSTILANGNGLFASKVNHPGTRAYQFIHRSNKELQQKSGGLFYKGVQDYLQRHYKNS